MDICYPSLRAPLPRGQAAAAACDPARFVSVPVDPGEHRQLLAVTAGAAGRVVRRPCQCRARTEDCPRVFCGAGMPCHGMVLTSRPCRGEFFPCNPSPSGVLRLPPWYFSAMVLLSAAAAAGRHKAVLLELVRAQPPCCSSSSAACSIIIRLN